MPKSADHLTEQTIKAASKQFDLDLLYTLSMPRANIRRLENLHLVPNLTELEKRCPGTHEHEPVVGKVSFGQGVCSGALKTRTCPSSSPTVLARKMSPSTSALVGKDNPGGRSLGSEPRRRPSGRRVRPSTVGRV